MSKVEATRGTGRGRRLGLNRQRVIVAAVDLIDRQGLDEFSLRRLAAELDVHPMSLYNHIADKDDILDGVVETVFAEMQPLPDPAASWQDQIRAGAALLRRAVLAHPNCAILVVVRPVITPSTLVVVQAALRTLLVAGLPTERAVYALRSFTALITATILREVSAPTLRNQSPRRTTEQIDSVASLDDPVIIDAARQLMVVDHDTAFDYSVELFIAGLSAQLRSTKPPPT